MSRRKEFMVRSVSGLVYAAIMIGAVTLHPVFFYLVFLFLLIAGMMEFYRLSPSDSSKPLMVAGILTAMAGFTLTFLVYWQELDPSWFLALIPALLIILVIPMFRSAGNPILSSGSTLAGILYVGVPAALFSGLVFHPYETGFDFQVGLLLFAVIWLNDTGAYIAGILTGKHKMFPRISPAKSWEGFAGGLALALLVSWLMQPLVPSIPAAHIWILTPVIVLTGTIGDFAESAWKRSAGVKDSGSLIPGHGGILDRLDSLFFAAPAVYFTINLLNSP